MSPVRFSSSPSTVSSLVLLSCAEINGGISRNMRMVSPSAKGTSTGTFSYTGSSATDASAAEVSAAGISGAVSDTAAVSFSDACTVSGADCVVDAGAFPQPDRIPAKSDRISAREPSFFFICVSPFEFGYPIACNVCASLLWKVGTILAQYSGRNRNTERRLFLWMKKHCWRKLTRWKRK